MATKQEPNTLETLRTAHAELTAQRDRLAGELSEAQAAASTVHAQLLAGTMTADAATQVQARESVLTSALASADGQLARSAQTIERAELEGQRRADMVKMQELAREATTAYEAEAAARRDFATSVEALVTRLNTARQQRLDIRRGFAAYVYGLVPGAPAIGTDPDVQSAFDARVSAFLTEVERGASLDAVLHTVDYRERERFDRAVPTPFEGPFARTLAIALEESARS